MIKIVKKILILSRLLVLKKNHCITNYTNLKHFITSILSKNLDKNINKIEIRRDCFLQRFI